MTRKTYYGLLVLLTTVVMLPTYASALPLALNGEYGIDAQAVQTTNNTWLFTYNITNINQSNSDPKTGLDGFTIQLPDTAVVINKTVPDAYWGAGYWGANSIGTSPPAWAADPNLATPSTGYTWYTWWGYEPPSVYPAGSIATFTIELANVAVGNNTSLFTTYWDYEGAANGEETWVRPGVGTEYTSFYGSILAPVTAPVPEPSALLLFGTGLAGLVFRRRKA